jgi:hypothetical protein
MSEPKRQRVSGEEWLLRLCVDSSDFFKFVDAWHANPIFPEQDETLTFDSLVRFLRTTFHTPFKLAEEISGFYFDAIARNLPDVRYFRDLDVMFYYVFDCWLTRVYLSLKINQSVSERVRRTLLNVHVKYDFWKQELDYGDDDIRTELYVLYWLTPPHFRNLFFQAKLENWDGVFLERRFNGDEIVKLLQPGDNMAFYIWALYLSKYASVGSIERDLNRLVIDTSERTCLHKLIIGCVKVAGDFGISAFGKKRMDAAILFENEKYAKLPNINVFSNCPTTIVKRQELWWLRDYLAIAHGCDVCTCEVLTWAFSWAQTGMVYCW